VSGAGNGAEQDEKQVSGSGAGLPKKERSGSEARSGRSANRKGAMSGLSSFIDFLETCAGTSTRQVP
jgi:hypothetical protein